MPEHSEATSYEIEIYVDGDPEYIVDVMTTQGLEAAKRRAKATIASTGIPFDRIVAITQSEGR